MKKFIILLLTTSLFMTNNSFCQVQTLQHKQGEQIETLFKTTSDLIDCQIQIQHFLENEYAITETLNTKIVAQDSIISELQNNIKYYIFGIVFLLVLLIILYIASYINILKLKDIISTKNELSLFNPLEEQEIIRLFHYSFDEINWDWNHLTQKEKNCISQHTFNSIRDKYRKKVS